jgi:hypothetical protein
MISRLKARLSSLDVESEENEGGRQRHDAAANIDKKQYRHDIKKQALQEMRLELNRIKLQLNYLAKMQEEDDRVCAKGSRKTGMARSSSYPCLGATQDKALPVLKKSNSHQDLCATDKERGKEAELPKVVGANMRKRLKRKQKILREEISNSSFRDMWKLLNKA